MKNVTRQMLEDRAKELFDTIGSKCLRVDVWKEGNDSLNANTIPGYWYMARWYGPNDNTAYKLEKTLAESYELLGKELEVQRKRLEAQND